MATARTYRVVGNSGSGKSTLAAAVAERLGVAHVELDAHFHLPGWQQAPTEQFQAAVRAALDAHPEGWVADGNYRSRLGDLLRPEVTVWLDYPRWVVGPRIVRRTLRRVLTGRELWNGNRERWSNLLSRSREENIVLWSFTQHRDYHERYLADSAADPTWVRLRSPREARRWLDSLLG